MRPASTLLIVGGLVLTLGAPASAQYFGRNKVRYRAFDFQVQRTEHFDLYFYAGEREGADVAARLAERWYARFERLFGHTLSGRQPLILYASHADFEQTNVIPDEIGEATGGVTEPGRRRIVLPMAGPIAETDHVIGHELVHAFQFDLAAGLARGGQPALAQVPLWFVEGMAEYLSLGGIDGHTAMKLRDAMRRERLPSLEDLDSPGYFPYQWGHAAFAYIAGRYGDEAIARLLRRAAADNVAIAVRGVLGLSPGDLSREWHAAIRAAYAPVLASSTPLALDSRVLVQPQRFGADLNVGPAISPDGRWVAFLSSRGLFSTDLYVADAATGRIVRKLTSTATNHHYSSIEFVDSTAAWDPASRRVAMGTVVGGRPTLAIFDARTGRRREIGVTGVDAILNPDWSPDGHAIAFTGMRQGLTDLYVYDLDTAALAQVTNDAFADLHPAWAPDSRRLVFSSDRFSSTIASLQMGALQLAILDTKTGALEPRPAFDTGKHINPRWSRDGQAVYFIGDPDGVSNVYRLSLADERIEQLTRLATGISGVTPSSPALSVSGYGRLAVSVFENDAYTIYVREPSVPAAPVSALAANAAVLPPADRRPGMLAALFADPEQGLPTQQTYPVEPYRSRLSLTGISQPTAGVGVGQFGATASGGAALVFGDTLGDHVLAAAAQINAGLTGSFSFRDLAFQTAYLNMARRWTWGVIAGQAPYVSAGFERDVSGTADGLVQTDRQIIYRQTERAGSGILAYPFDRGRRVEFRGGLSQTSFERTTKATVASATTHATLSETTTTQPIAAPLTLGTTAIALVLDSANFGPTGPINGKRYRLEVAPTLGSIDFTGVLIDYRRYVMPASFWTVAARAFHYGRYGAGGDDARLQPIYLASPGLVRGYNTFGYGTTCVPAAGGCLSSDPLLGSRVFVSSVELRFPALRPLGVSSGMYGPIPVELAVFADGGVAWTARDRPALAGGTRPAISSAGIAVRLAYGPLVAELDFARPLQRPDQGWVFGFNLIPAW